MNRKAIGKEVKLRDESGRGWEIILYIMSIILYILYTDDIVLILESRENLQYCKNRVNLEKENTKRMEEVDKFKYFGVILSGDWGRKDLNGAGRGKI